MRIVAVVGSVRRGNTYAMVEAACHALRDFDVQLVHLKDVLGTFCDGCLACDETGTCHIADDSMNEIVESIREADGFVFGTPARWSLLSGEMKTFFDRLNPLAAPNALSGKRAIVFAVGQTPATDKSVELAASSVRFFCDNAGIEVVDTVLAFECLRPSDLIASHPDVLERCKDAAGRLAAALQPT